MGAIGVYTFITIEYIRQNWLWFVYNVTQNPQTNSVALFDMIFFYISILNWLFVVRRADEYRTCY